MFFKQRVKNRSLEDVVVLNVDTNTLESPFNDLSNLPSDVVSPRDVCGEQECLLLDPQVTIFHFVFEPLKLVYARVLRRIDVDSIFNILPFGSLDFKWNSIFLIVKMGS